MTNWQLINSDVIDGLRQLPDASVHCVVTSPPYLWQRDYQCEGQIGLENSVEEYLLRLISVFAEVRRVMHPGATLWINIADGYVNDTKWGGRSGHKNGDSAAGGYQRIMRSRKSGMPPKCLMAIPARFQVKMIDAGWICRNEIIWHKPTARPENVQDRCSRDHEQVFLFSKSPKYYYDLEAVKQPASPKTVTVKTSPRKGNGTESAGERWSLYMERNGRYAPESRNLRTVWSICAEPSSEQHYAAFPEALVGVCVMAGSREGDLVCDPFAGTSTTGVVALRLGRRFIGIDLSKDYIEISERRLREAERNAIGDLFLPLQREEAQQGLFTEAANG